MYAPYGRARSLTAKLLLLDDNSWLPGVAATLRWAREVWESGLRHSACLGMVTLRASWDLARAGHAAGPQTWTSVRGPIGAMLLELRRVGWTMKSWAVLRSAQGHEVPLTELSPARVAKLLQEAIRDRWHADLGAKYANGQRVSLDPLRAESRRKRRHGEAKALIRSFGRVGAHTRTSLRAMGYEVDTLRPHAGRRRIPFTIACICVIIRRRRRCGPAP